MLELIVLFGLAAAGWHSGIIGSHSDTQEFEEINQAQSVIEDEDAPTDNLLMMI